MVKLLHTSDIQLGATFDFLGEGGSRHRQQLRDTFTRIMELAVDDGYDVVLIAGDLFDSNQPSHATVEFVRRALGGLKIPVCILPGNHDCFDNRSVYRREKFGANVHVITESPTYLDFPELDLTIAGNPLLGRQDSLRVLRDIKRRAPHRWFVAMAHGSLQIPGVTEDTVRPIHAQDIVETGADYVALGDWHGFADYSRGAVKACYSGAPEPSASTQEGTGSIARVTLRDEGVRVEKVRVGRVTTKSVTIDVMGLAEADIVEQIHTYADPDCILSVHLAGMKAVEDYVDVSNIYATLASEFYGLRIEDSSTPSLATIDPSRYPETHVIGQYVRLLMEQIDRAQDERSRRIATHALQIGVALLQGKEVLP